MITRRFLPSRQVSPSFDPQPSWTRRFGKLKVMAIEDEGQLTENSCENPPFGKGLMGGSEGSGLT